MRLTERPISRTPARRWREEAKSAVFPDAPKETRAIAEWIAKCIRYMADEGYAGTVIRYRDAQLWVDGDRMVVGAGVDLQGLVDASIRAGFEGLHTMTGIPGWVGGAVYGNAGAYGHSVHEFLETVRFWDGAQVREFTNAECEFRYRESIFKRQKDWVILNATFRLPRSTDREKTREEGRGQLQERFRQRRR